MLVVRPQDIRFESQGPPDNGTQKPKFFFWFSELNFRKIEVSICHSICLDELIKNISPFSLKMLQIKSYGVAKLKQNHKNFQKKIIKISKKTL